MSHKVIDKYKSRSTRTRRNRVEQGLCPDCGGINGITITRCLDCRKKRSEKRKLRLKNENNRKVEWNFMGRS